MAKSSKARRPDGKGKPQESERKTKKQIARSRKEARQNRILFFSIGALILLILAIAIVGIVQELVIKPSRPVAMVNGSRIPIDEYQDLLTYRRYTLHLNENSVQSGLDSIDPTQEGNDFLVTFYQQQLGAIQQAIAAAPEDTLEEMIEDELIKEKAQELGITVTDQDVQQLITDDLQSAAAPPAQTITETTQISTPVPQEQLDQIYQNILDSMGLTDKGFRTVVQRGILRERVQEALASQVVTTGLVVHVQLIQTTTEEEALAAKERIDSGEDFGVVAQEVSTDTLTAESGGDLGWVTTGQLAASYGTNVEDQVFSMSPGEMAIVESLGNYYVIQVLERDENGPLPEDIVAQRQNSALSDWLAERQASPDVSIERLLTPDQIPPDPFGTGLGVAGP
jgi:parvulin-like peptidyl-prolyl isomerase